MLSITLRSPLPIFIACLFLSGCEMFLPKDYKQGEKYFEAKDYGSASESYQKADIAKPDNFHITSGLLKSNAYQASTLLEWAQNARAEDLDKRVEYLEKAVESCRTASMSFQEIMVIKPIDDFSMVTAPNSLLPIEFGDAEASYEEKMLCYSKGMPQIMADIKSQLSRDSLKQSEVLAEVDTVLAMIPVPPDGPIQAYQAFKPLVKYTPYMAKVDAAKRAIEQTTVNFYEARGLHYVSKNNFVKAKQDFQASFKVISKNPEGQAGLLAIQAKQAFFKNEFELAYADMKKIHALHPTSAFYSKHMNNVRTKVVLRGLAKAAKKGHKKTSTNRKKMFDIYQDLKPIAEPAPVLAEKVAMATKALQVELARSFLLRANKLSKKQSLTYPSSVTALLNAANQFNPESITPPVAKLADRSLSVSLAQQKLPVVFLAASKLGKAKELDDWLSDEVYESLKDLDENRVQPTHAGEVDVISRQLNKGGILAGRAIKGAPHEAVLLLTLKTHSFKEYGRNKPRKKKSRYVSERYMVHNKAKDRAKIDMDRARQTYDAAKELADIAYNECKSAASSAGGGLLGDIVGSAACKMGTNALRGKLTGYDAAKNAYYSMPSEIEKKKVSPYSYKEYTIGVKGSIVAELVAYDLRNKTMKKLETFKLSFDESGIKRSNVESEDVNDLRDGEFDVPTVIDVTEQVQGQLLSKIIRKSSSYLMAHSSTRFCQHGDRLMKKRRTTAAVESYLQCAKMIKDKSRDDVRTAQKAINKYIGFSEEESLRYGANTNKSLISSLNGVQLSSKEMDAALQASQAAF